MSVPQGHHVDPFSLSFVPIPSSTSPTTTVKITMLHTGSLHSARVYFRGGRKLEDMGQSEEAVVFAWVIEKDFGNGVVKRYLWDLGVVCSYDKVPKSFATEAAIRFRLDVPHYAQLPALLTHLSPPPATLESLSGLILSHAHFDHYGALDEFPSALPMYVGPGTSAWIAGGDEEGGQPGFPTKYWRSRDFIGEVGGDGAKGDGDGKEDRSWKAVGAYEKAWDWFGDGSLWLAQAPGHCPGHMVAIARVSTSPDTYVVLGGDTCHSQRIYLPVPAGSPPDDQRSPIACFAHPREGPHTIPGTHTMHLDLQEAYVSVARLTRMEAEDNIMCVLAHETEVARMFGLNAGDMKGGWDGWKGAGWKDERAQGMKREEESSK